MKSRETLILIDGGNDISRGEGFVVSAVADNDSFCTWKSIGNDGGGGCGKDESLVVIIHCSWSKKAVVTDVPSSCSAHISFSENIPFSSYITFWTERQ